MPNTSLPEGIFMNRKCVWSEGSTNKYDRTKKEMPEFCKKLGCDGTEEYARKHSLSCFYPITEDIQKHKSRIGSLMLLSV